MTFFRPHASIVCANIDLNQFHLNWPPEGLHKLLADYLTAEEISRFLSFPVKKRQREWFAGRVAAKCALSSFRGMPQKYSATPIHCWESGRPYIDSRTHVSISHSRDSVFAVIGDMPLGIDTELYTRVTAQSLSELIRMDEVTAVMQGQQCAMQQAVTLIWCLKEALFKACGEGGFALFAKAITLLDWRGGNLPQWIYQDNTDPFHPAHAHNWRVQLQLTPSYAQVLVYRKY